MQSGTKMATPSKVQIRRLTLDLQKSALTCDVAMKEVASNVFSLVCRFRNLEKHFPYAQSDLDEAQMSKTSDIAFPPLNPYKDLKRVSPDLLHELENSFGPMPATCKIIIEHDTSLSGAFPLTLKNVKLKPDKDLPGTIVIKHHGDYYVALWCMGFDGKPIIDTVTNLPFVLFKDYSTEEVMMPSKSI